MTQLLQTLFITDVPYWDRRTGAQLRISQLIEAMDHPPFRSESLITQSPSDFNQASIQRESPHPIHFIDLSHPPVDGFADKLKWQWEAILNAIGWNRQPTANHTTRRLDHYLPKPIVDRTVKFVQSNDPDIIVCEYLSHLAIVRALPEAWRKKKILILDSHDVLWKRNEQFGQNGSSHWIDIEKTEEEQALREFDLVVAIQQDEANYFASLIGEDKVITIGMEFETIPITGDSHSNQIKVGYLASNNAANLQAAEQILSVWTKLNANNSKLTLILAGTVCQNPSLKEQARDLPHVQLLGPVEQVEDFYNQVDVVWNPIQIGTGLKIKNLEAMAQGKCLVTSTHGAVGLGPKRQLQDTEQLNQPFLVADSIEQVLSIFNGLDSAIISKYSSLGSQFVEKYYGTGTQYQELRQKLASLFSEKSS